MQHFSRHAAYSACPAFQVCPRWLLSPPRAKNIVIWTVTNPANLDFKGLPCKGENFKECNLKKTPGWITWRRRSLSSAPKEILRVLKIRIAATQGVQIKPAKQQLSNKDPAGLEKRVRYSGIGRIGCDVAQLVERLPRSVSHN